MRAFLLIILFFSLETFACGKEPKDFTPFSIEFVEKGDPNPDKKIKSFGIFSPVQKGNFFLRSITAKLDGEFSAILDIHEDFDYAGYYSSELSIASKYVGNVEIILSYMTTRKDRSDITFCADMKTYKLTELLNSKAAQATPAFHE